MPVIVMGVSGSGKSTVGPLLAAALGRPFVDADDLHDEHARAKLHAGIPLTDDDRWPWLARVAAVAAGAGDPVVACSALKVVYRDALREAASDAYFVHLRVAPAVLADRLSHREHEFMSPTLLGSQLATVEDLAPHEHGVTVDATLPPDAVVAEVLAAMAADGDAR